MIFKKLKWRYKDLLFNLALLKPGSLLAYYGAVLSGTKHVKVSVKGVERKFLIRTKNRVDRSVLEYVFFKQYHLPPKEFKLRPRPTIIDLGSNIGCTLVDFKFHYPDALVVGYEMHPENFKLAQANTEGLEGVSLVNKAVWKEDGKVAFDRKNLTDAFAIEKNPKNGLDTIEIPAVSMPQIISHHNLSEIDYLKMDIEGAELEIFDADDLSWLHKVQALNIEFHNISETDLTKYIEILKLYNFTVYKSPHHWLSLLGYKS